MASKYTYRTTTMLRDAETSAVNAYRIAAVGRDCDEDPDGYCLGMCAQIDTLMAVLVSQNDEPIAPSVVYHLVAVRRYFMTITFDGPLATIYKRAMDPVRAYGHDTEMIGAAERSLSEDFDHLEKVLFNRSRYSMAYVLYAVLFLAALRLIYRDLQRILRDSPK